MRYGTRLKRKSCVYGAIALGFALFLTGCTLEVGHYEAKGIVEPETVPKTLTVAQALPWNVILDFLASVLPTMGQTRRLAIEKGRGYTEERSMTLLRVQKASTFESKVEKQGENHSSQKRQELK